MEPVGGGAPGGPSAVGLGPGHAVIGLDVGVGANAIYPLLACALHADWAVVGVDVTDTAVEWAARNVAANDRLRDRIQIRRVRPPEGVSDASVAPGHGTEAGNEAGASIRSEVGAGGGWGERYEAQVVLAGGKQGALGPWRRGGVLRGAIAASERFTFSMCNPPFFEDAAEAGGNPRTNYAGTNAEMVCPGGEAAFCKRIAVDRSEATRGCGVRWTARTATGSEGST